MMLSGLFVLSQNRDTVCFNDAFLWYISHFELKTPKPVCYIRHSFISGKEELKAYFKVRLVVDGLSLLWPAADRCKEVQQIRDQHPNKIPVSCCSNLLLFYTHRWPILPEKFTYSLVKPFECDVYWSKENKVRQKYKIESYRKVKSRNHLAELLNCETSSVSSV